MIRALQHVVINRCIDTFERGFPFVKRALGYGHTRQRVQFDGHWLERNTTPTASQAARA